MPNHTNIEVTFVDEKFIDKLLKLFQNVNDWLKYAEAKNAVLLAFSGAVITAVVTYLSTASKPLASLKIGLLINVSLLALCSLITAVSFLPKTDLEHFNWLNSKPSKVNNRNLKPTDNLYHFGDLQKYKSSELVDAINNSYFNGSINQPYKKEHLDITNQIITNSQIAIIKFSLFTKAIWILILSILVIPMSLVFSLIVYRHL
jgi:hypothetical protein